MVVKYALVIASLKNLNVCKSYFYIQMVMFIAENFLASRSMDEVEVSNLLNLLLGVFFFVGFCFDFWPNTFALFIFYTSNPIARHYLYNESFDIEVVSNLMMNSFMTFIMCATIQIIINRIGFTFIDAVLLKEGNEQLLNNLEEGVVIFDEE